MWLGRSSARPLREATFRGVLIACKLQPRNVASRTGWAFMRTSVIIYVTNLARKCVRTSIGPSLMIPSCLLVADLTVYGTVWSAKVNDVRIIGFRLTCQSCFQNEDPTKYCTYSSCCIVPVSRLSSQHILLCILTHPSIVYIFLPPPSPPLPWNNGETQSYYWKANYSHTLKHPHIKLTTITQATCMHARFKVPSQDYFPPRHYKIEKLNDTIHSACFWQTVLLAVHKQTSISSIPLASSIAIPTFSHDLFILQGPCWSEPSRSCSFQQ